MYAVERERQDDLVKRIHKIFTDEGVTYSQAMWVLKTISKQYEEKGCQFLDRANIQEVAAVRFEKMKEQLY